MLTEEEIEVVIEKWEKDFKVKLTEDQRDALITRLYDAMDDKLH